MPAHGQLLAPARGLLALDQAETRAIEMLRDAKVPASAATLQGFRDLVLGTPGLERMVSGVLVDPATLHRVSAHGATPALRRQHVPVGVRMGDETRRGLDVAGSVDDLTDEAVAHRVAGASFARWRIVTGDGTVPTDLRSRARLVAGWAATCLGNGLTPFVDVVVVPGARDDLGAAEREHGSTVSVVIEALLAAGVDTADVVLGSSLVVPGRRQVATADDIARATLRSLRAAVPGPLAGVAFTPSGRPDRLTAHLAAMQWQSPSWPIGFCLGRSMLVHVARTWAARPERVLDAQTELLNRLNAARAVVRSGMSETHRRVAG